jgi:DNA repair protein RadC
MIKLYVRTAAGRYEVADEETTLEGAAAVLESRFRHPGVCLSAPAQTREYLVIKLRDRPAEVFCALFLDNRHRLIEFRELFQGTIDGASVHPREVGRQALEVNAAAVIFAHNHPSGVAQPSMADELITKRLRDALSLVDIRVLDHLIVGAQGVCSFAERGLI